MFNESYVHRTNIADQIETATPSYPTLYILLGGSGMKTATRLRRRILESYGINKLPFQEFLWMDTDRADLKSEIFSDEPIFQERLKFAGDDTVELSVSIEQMTDILGNRHNYPWLERWKPHSVIEHLGRNAGTSDGARQIRPLGRLSFELNFREFKRIFSNKIQKLTRVGLAQECREFGFEITAQHIEIVILCSIAGGTGSGAFLQVARAARSLSNNLTQITGYFFMPSIFENIPGGLTAEMSANAYASLQELNSVASSSPEDIWIGDYRDHNAIQNPFNQIYLIEKTNTLNVTLQAPTDKDAYLMVADSLFYDFEQSDFGMKKRSHRNNVSPHLMSITYYSIPVNDDTYQNNDIDKPRYVFKFPTCFGALGVSRIPFDRQRLQRAASALLVSRMFKMLLTSDNAIIDRDMFRRRVLVQANISTDQVIERLILDGSTGSTFDVRLSNELRAFGENLRQKVIAQYDIVGISDREFVTRLRALGAFCTDLNQKISTRVAKLRAEVLEKLSSQNGPAFWGEHHRSIMERQNQIFQDYRSSFRQAVSSLLSQPSERGFPYAEELCRMLHVDLERKENEARNAKEPDFPDIASLQLSIDDQVEEAMEMLAEAQALWLPGYGQVARSYYKNLNQKLLEDTSNSIITKASNYINSVYTSFDNWARDYYVYIASKNSAQLFLELKNFIGHRIEVAGEVGADKMEVRATGMSSELNKYRTAISSSEAYFMALYDGYMRVEESVRNSQPIVPKDRLINAFEAHIKGEATLNIRSSQELMVDEWSSFITQAGGSFVAPGEGGVIERLVRRLLEFAVENINQAHWASLHGELEKWSARRMHNLLSQQSALEELAQASPMEQQRQLDHISRSAAPWVQFVPAGARHHKSSLLIGSTHNQSTVIQSWRQKSPDEWTGITNNSGSVTIYREEMVFPLYELRSIEQLENIYLTMNDIKKAQRHTLADYLRLQRIRPPQDDREATKWFKIDRDALAAVLFGLFSYNDDTHELNYSQRRREGQIIRVSLCKDLIGLSRKLHNDLNVTLLDNIRAEVSELERLIYSDHHWAVLCLQLVVYTFNTVFPAHEDNNLHPLEHELARSLARKWSVEMCKDGSSSEGYLTNKRIKDPNALIHHFVDHMHAINLDNFVETKIVSESAQTAIFALRGRERIRNTTEVPRGVQDPFGFDAKITDKRLDTNIDSSVNHTMRVSNPFFD